MLRNWSLNPLAKVAIAILRSYGADAHIYLPGVGTVNGITAGNYLDSAGTTAASVDNPVGLSLDALQAMTLGGEKVTNGDGSSLAGWTAVGTSTNTIENNKFKLTAVGAPSISGGLRQDIAAVAGVWNRISIDIEVTAIASGRAQVLVYDGAAFTPEIFNVQKTAVGTYAISGVVKPTGSTIRVYFLVAADASGTTTAYFDNISVREITGIHATQATTANKPILRRGAVNLLLQSQDFSAWSGAGVTKAPNTITAPDGTTTACRLTFTGASQDFAVQVPATAGDKTGHLWIKGIASQTIQTQHGGAGPKTTLTGEWQKVTYVSTVTFLANFDINTYGGSTARIVDIWHPQLEVGNTASEYSPTTTAAASNPSAGKYSWQFDQSNDFLQTTITTGDEGWVCAGVTFTDSNSTLFCSGAGSAGQKGLWAYRNAASDVYTSLIGNGTAITSPVSISAPAGVPLVVSSGWDASSVITGVNNSETTAARTGSASPSPANLRIGAYTDGTTYALGGSMNIALAFSVLPTAEDRLTLKRFVGQLSGVSI